MSRNNISKYLLYLSLLVFPFAELLKFPVFNGIKISLLEIILIIFCLSCLSLRQKIKPLVYTDVLLFSGFSFLSILVNSQSQIFFINNLAYLLRFMLYFLFYFQLLKFVKTKNLRRINFYFVISGFIFCVLGITQYVLYPDLRNLLYLGWDPHYYRLFGTFFDPNFAGVFLVLLLFQLIFMLELTRHKLILFLIIVINLFAIYLTRSRTAYLSLIAGLVGFFAWYKKDRKIIFLILSFVLLISSFIPKPNLDVYDFFRVTTSVSRINNWKSALIMGFSNPLFGKGFVNAKFSDSSFLYVFAGAGVLGLFFFSRIWLKIIYYGWKEKFEIFIISIVMIVSSFFNNTLFYPWILYWLVVFLAINRKNFKVDN